MLEFQKLPRVCWRKGRVTQDDVPTGNSLWPAEEMPENFTYVWASRGVGWGLLTSVSSTGHSWSEDELWDHPFTGSSFQKKNWIFKLKIHFENKLQVIVFYFPLNSCFKKEMKIWCLVRGCVLTQWACTTDHLIYASDVLMKQLYIVQQTESVLGLGNLF